MKWTRLFAIVLAAAAVAGVLLVRPTTAERRARLEIQAPAQVAAGTQFEITLVLHEAAGFGGYEAALRYDPAAAHFNGLVQRLEPLTELGRGLGELGAVERGDGIAFGAYSCPVAICEGPRDGQRRSRGADGTVPLATIALIADQPGTLEVSLADLLVVDADGAPLPMTVSSQTVQVQVDPPGAGPLFPAPTTTPAAERGQPQPAAAGALDLTGDGRVTHADVIEAALAWTLEREAGVTCGSAGMFHDVDGDGCVNVADIVRIAAGYSPPDPQVASADNMAGATFTVNTTADDDDAAPGDGVCAGASGACTLRAAIVEANRATGPNTIAFAIPGGGVQTIAIARPLPTLNDETGATTIDGYTQPGAAPNSDALASNAVIRVQLAPAANVAPATIEALLLTSGGNTVRGLALFKFRRSLWAFGAAADRNVIAGCFVGTDAAASYAAPAIADSGNGIELSQGASDNRIGGTSPADRNVISGNPKHGVATFNGGTDRNQIIGNLIGLAPKGDRRVPNISFGVDINSHSSNNVVGGSGPGERNVISGNGGEGVEVSHGQRTVGNRVVGNYIGTDVSGTRGPSWSPNGWNGVHIEDGPVGTVVTQNVIGNNRGGGVSIDGFETGFFPSSSQVSANRIGISADGTAIPNGNYGVRLKDSTARNTIGPDNTIANSPVGVLVLGADTDGNTITRNVFANLGGPGIDLEPAGGPNPNDEGDADAGPNQQLNTPVLARAVPLEVRGTACAGCVVEVFRADAANGPGAAFLASVTAGGDGSFAVRVSSLAVGQHVTATATDAQGNTSEFAPSQKVIAGAPSVATSSTTLYLPAVGK
jgi:CSLREA domain-containing protein